MYFQVRQYLSPISIPIPTQAKFWSPHFGSSWSHPSVLPAQYGEYNKVVQKSDAGVGIFMLIGDREGFLGLGEDNIISSYLILLSANSWPYRFILGILFGSQIMGGAPDHGWGAAGGGGINSYYFLLIHGLIAPVRLSAHGS